MHPVGFIATLLLLAFGQGAVAHTLSPSYEKKTIISDTFEMQYEVGNHYSFPATYEIDVLTKEGAQAKGWKVKSALLKIKPHSKKSFLIVFKSREPRKLMVCTKLASTGYEEEPAQVISRVCSRLWLNRIG